eukprot:scaffold367_cov254-Pinguiococcus_pyrenoidosus.AAC.5
MSVCSWLFTRTHCWPVRAAKYSTKLVLPTLVGPCRRMGAPPPATTALARLRKDVRTLSVILGLSVTPEPHPEGPYQRPQARIVATARRPGERVLHVLLVQLRSESPNGQVGHPPRALTGKRGDEAERETLQQGAWHRETLRSSQFRRCADRSTERSEAKHRPRACGVHEHVPVGKLLHLAIQIDELGQHRRGRAGEVGLHHEEQVLRALQLRHEDLRKPTSQ